MAGTIDALARYTAPLVPVTEAAAEAAAIASAAAEAAEAAAEVATTTSIAAIANGTAVDAGALTGVETLPMSRGAGLRQSNLTQITQFVRRMLAVYVVVITGQSNAAGTHKGGPNPASSLVKVFDGVTGTWGSSDYTQNPFARGYPDGNNGNNNIGLAFAHRLADETGAKVYVVYDAWGGRPIEDWVGAGTASVRYAGICNKVLAALASPELVAAGKTTIDALIWDQGQENALTDDFATFQGKFGTVDSQFRAEPWMQATTPMFVMGMSTLHDRYQVVPAQLNYCESINRNCIYVNAAGCKTAFDVGATQLLHLTSTTNFRKGNTVTAGAATGTIVYVGTSYVAIGSVVGTFVAGPVTSSGGGAATITSVVDDSDWTHWLGDSLWELGYKRCWNVFQERGTSHRQQTPLFFSRGNGPLKMGDSVAIATFSTLIGYGCATSTFPINGSGATYSLQWGWQNVGSNYSLVTGYQNTQDSLARYGAMSGRSNVASAGADYHLVGGYQNTVVGAYTAAFGRGHNVVDPYCVAFGAFSKYRVTLADPAILQVANGTNTGGGVKNLLTVFGSGLSQFNGTIDFEVDNAYSLATASHRASVVYAATGSINTSDARTKQIRGALTAPEMAAWSQVQPCIYQFLDAIAEKGEEGARLHAGLIAQEVMAAFLAQDLDPNRYALFCEDEIFETKMVEQTVTTKKQKTVPGKVQSIELIDGRPILVEQDAEIPQFETMQVTDADGLVVVDEKTGQPITMAVPIMEEVEEVVAVPVQESKGPRYGLRYTECLIFEAAYLRSKVAEIEARMDASGV